MFRVDRVNGEFPDALSFSAGTRYEIYADQLATGAGNRSCQLAERFLSRVEFDTDGDAVLGAYGWHRATI